MINAFTIDVEDYFHVSGFEHCVARCDWHHFESRVVANSHRLLDIMDDHGVQGTFFVLGWVADRHPELVEEIHRRGHEIGSHGYWHRLIYKQTPNEFREDLIRSRDRLEDIVGLRVESFRAPSFSITQRSLWALEVLVQEGFTMDSSIYPIRHDRYGIPGGQRGPHCIHTASGDLWEFPPTVARIAGMNVPVGGGGYFRLFPVGWTNLCLSRVQLRQHTPAMFYIHPWEIDPDQPRLSVTGRMNRFRHYVNLAHTERKLSRLFNEFQFGCLSDALAPHRDGDVGKGNQQNGESLFLPLESFEWVTGVGKP
jgi:polysaccharide deacetylase family protein (PEP-CTERM system associated)